MLTWRGIDDMMIIIGTNWASRQGFTDIAREFFKRRHVQPGQDTKQVIDDGDGNGDDDCGLIMMVMMMLIKMMMTKMMILLSADKVVNLIWF